MKNAIAIAAVAATNQAAAALLDPRSSEEISSRLTEISHASKPPLTPKRSTMAHQRHGQKAQRRAHQR